MSGSDSPSSTSPADEQEPGSDDILEEKGALEEVQHDYDVEIAKEVEEERLIDVASGEAPNNQDPEDFNPDDRDN